MPSLEEKPPLVVIVGPTAVGKTELALRLAERMNGEIVSADSRYFYRGMDIGTAKPTPEELKRVPHHLVDVTDPDQTWSLALFQQEARRAVAEIHRRGRMPFLVGGTGQYIHAVIEEWRLPPQPPTADLREALERWGRVMGPENLHARLAVLDPEAAGHIEPHNLRRTVRALEVIFYTGRRFSVQRQRLPSLYRLMIIGLTRPRSELYARIDARIDEMFRRGLVEEVRGLLAKGYNPGLPALSAIGYEQVIDYLRGRMTYEEAVRAVKRLTRQFVRRQANWFKESDPRIHWYHPDEPDVLDKIEGLIQTGAWLVDPE